MSLSDLLRRNVTLDGCGDKIETKKKPTLDAISESAEKYAMQDMKIKAANAIQAWKETDDLGDDETNAERLMNLFVGIVDANKDGEISEEESNYLEALLNYAWDYLSERGIDEDDIESLLNDFDADAADRVMDLLNGESDDDDLDSFAFGDDEQEAVFDAVYKNVAAVRGGKKVRLRKKISGSVRLTAKQKVAIRKMQLKSHSAGAQMKRMKSLKVRKHMGM
jgi:hypothetical protein